MLGIVWGLEKFNHYVFGRSIKVQTDHKPLVSITRKNLVNATPRLARMLIHTQPYNIDVEYVPGKQIQLADALSRITPLDRKAVVGLDLSVHEVRAYLNASTSCMSDIHEMINKDPELCMLRDTITEGWPEFRHDCPSILQPYWNYRDELAVEDGLPLKGTKLIIPKQMQPEVLNQIHSGHLGIEKCRLRARTTVFWNGLHKDIEELVLKCSTCQRHQASQPKE